MTSARSLLKAWHLHAKKQFGQHFLNSAETGRALAALSGIGGNDQVLEIGAGLGALTIPLAERAGRVVAVERDSQLVGLLRTEVMAAGLGNVDILAADILTVDLPKIAQACGGRMIVAGNLPYNISSQVLVRLVEARRFLDRAVLMFQKELAERMLSPPGRRTYGRLTVMINYCAEVSMLKELKSTAFYPRPKIDSAVIEIRFRRPSPVAAVDEKALFRLVRAAFGQRRKMLRNALSAGGFDAKLLSDAFAATGISGDRRAETLSVEEFVRFSNWITQRAGTGQDQPQR